MSKWFEPPVMVPVACLAIFIVYVLCRT